MAKRDLRLDAEFFDHPKTDDLEQRLGAAGVVALVRLWCFAAKKHTDGRFDRYSVKELERIAKWRGEPGALVAALTEPTWRGAGWLDQTATGFQIHDWQGNQTYLFHADERSERARHAAEAKHRKRDQNLDDSARRIRDASAEQAGPEKPDAPYPYPSPLPYPSPSVGAEIRSADSAPDAVVRLKDQTQEMLPAAGEGFELKLTPTPSREDPVVLTFPVVGKPDEWDLRRSLIAEMQATYTSIDVEAQCREALQWVKSKPRNKKTPGGMRAFLTGWMSREQKDVRRYGGPQKAAPLPPPKPTSVPQLVIPNDPEERRRMTGELRLRPKSSGYVGSERIALMVQEQLFLDDRGPPAGGEA